MKDEEKPIKVIAVHHHWKFWKPKRDLIGGPIYFGYWVEMEGCPDQSEEQFRIKRSMGFLDE